MALNRSPEFHCLIVQIVCIVVICLQGSNSQLPFLESAQRNYYMINIHESMWPCCVSGLNNLARGHQLY